MRCKVQRSGPGAQRTSPLAGGPAVEEAGAEGGIAPVPAVVPHQRHPHTLLLPALLDVLRSAGCKGADESTSSL